MAVGAGGWTAAAAGASVDVTLSLGCCASSGVTVDAFPPLSEVFCSSGNSCFRIGS